MAYTSCFIIFSQSGRDLVIPISEVLPLWVLIIWALMSKLRDAHDLACGGGRDGVWTENIISPILFYFRDIIISKLRKIILTYQYLIRIPVTVLVTTGALSVVIILHLKLFYL